MQNSAAWTIAVDLSREELQKNQSVFRFISNLTKRPDIFCETLFSYLFDVFLSIPEE